MQQQPVKKALPKQTAHKSWASYVAGLAVALIVGLAARWGFDLSEDTADTAPRVRIDDLHETPGSKLGGHGSIELFLFLKALRLPMLHH